MQRFLSIKDFYLTAMMKQQCLYYVLCKKNLQFPVSNIQIWTYGESQHNWDHIICNFNGVEYHPTNQYQQQLKQKIAAVGVTFTKGA